MEKGKVKILLGSHGSGKSKWLYDYMITSSRDPQNKNVANLKKRLFLVVPEQDTNDKQRLLMNVFKDKELPPGLINIDVISFDRLAHNICDLLKIRLDNENIIDDSGKTMILSLVISELNKEKELCYYGKMTNKIGFAKKMMQAVSECYLYDLIDKSGDYDNFNDDDKIKKIIDKELTGIAVDKLSDIKKITKRFLKKLKEMGFSIKEDRYDKLNEALDLLGDNDKDKNIFDNSIVVFEGFTGFTPIQLEIFRKIEKLSNEVYIAIDFRNEELEKVDFVSLIDKFKKHIDMTENVFYLSEKFIYDIYKALEKNYGDGKIDINNIIFKNYNSDDGVVYKYISDEKKDLRFLEKNIYNYSNEKVYDGTPKNILLYEAKNVDDEIKNIAHFIKKTLKSDSSLKYSDFKIVVPNVAEYSDKLISVFDKYSIPLFVDSTKSILNSPYIEVIRAAIDVIDYNFTYDSVMRYINSGIFEKTKEIKEIDNFIRKYGIQGKNRYEKGFEEILSFNENLIDGDDIKRLDNFLSYKKRILDAKNTLFKPLIDLYNEIKGKNEKGKNKSVKGYISAIENFCLNIDLDSKFNIFLDELEKRTLNQDFQIEILRESIDVKNKTILLINKIFSSNEYTNVELSIDEFKSLFDIGFTDLEIKVIPRWLDQVVVGDLMRSRFDNPKFQICMGFNQSLVPVETTDTTIIDDYIRKVLIDNDINISQTTYETALNQRLYLYLTLTNQTEKLILSYPRLNIGRTSDTKSTVIMDIQNLFGKKTMVDDESTFATSLNEIKVDISNIGFYSKDDLKNYVAENMQELRRKSFDENYDNNETLAVIKAIRYLNKNDENFKNTFENVYNNVRRKVDDKLDESIVKKVVEKERGDFKASATYIESYEKCNFRHFLERTIKLKGRETYEVSSLDLGNFLHNILETIYANNSYDEINEIIDSGKLGDFINKIINDTANRYLIFSDIDNKDKYYFGVNRAKIIKNISNKLIESTVLYINEIEKNSRLKKVEVEQEFKHKISDKIIIEGRIDKVEEYEDDKNIYINIIDYKSDKKPKEIKMDDIENGYTIQLLLYLDYMIKGRNKNKNIIPCGSFYFWIDNPIIRIKDNVTIADVSNERNKKLKYEGLANDSEDIIKMINSKLASSYSADDSINEFVDKETGFTVSGEFVNTSEGDLTKNSLNNLISDVHKKIEDAVDGIKKGRIDNVPYEEKYCNYCPYINICRVEKNYMKENDEDESSDANNN